MEVIAEVFQNPRSGFMEHTYWKDLDDLEKMVNKDPLDQDDTKEPSCTLM